MNARLAFSIIVFNLFVLPMAASAANTGELAQKIRSLQTLNPSQRAVLQALENFRAARLACDGLLARVKQGTALEKNLLPVLEQAPDWLLTAVNLVFDQNGRIENSDASTLTSQTYDLHVSVYTTNLVNRKAPGLREILKRELLAVHPLDRLNPNRPILPRRIEIVDVGQGFGDDKSGELSLRVEIDYGYTDQHLELDHVPMMANESYAVNVAYAILTLIHHQVLIADPENLQKEIHGLHNFLSRLQGRQVRAFMPWEHNVSRMEKFVEYLKIKKQLIDLALPRLDTKKDLLTRLERTWFKNDPFYMLVRPWFVRGTYQIPNMLFTALTEWEAPDFGSDRTEADMQPLTNLHVKQW